MVGEKWSAVRCDTGNDVGIVKTHETKSRGETLLIIRLAGVVMGRWIVGYALGDSRGVIEGGVIRRVTELRGGCRIAVVNGLIAAVPKVVEI